MGDRAFIVGVQRCGTSYLYRLLDDHPQIAMAKPLRPEPKVFLGDAVTGDPDAYDLVVFPENPSALVRAEKSTSYMEDELALARIAATFPQASFLVVLRDPIERALSHYRFSVDSGLERRSTDIALLGDLDGREPPYDERISVSPFAYVRRGRYIEALERLERHAPRDRILVLMFEELTTDRASAGAVYRFLGVDAGHRPTIAGEVVNASHATSALSPNATALLRAHYEPLNAELAAHLGRPLDRWQ